MKAKHRQFLLGIGLIFFFLAGFGQKGMVQESSNQNATTTCSVSDILVNSCHPWFAASSYGYLEVGKQDIKTQILYLEKRMGRQADIIHTYHKADKPALSEDELYFINRPNTYLAATWKPSATWADAGGGNASVNADMDTFARSIKAIAPRKIFLSIWHEPEPSVSGGASACDPSLYKGDKGTPAQYRAMWQNVRNRFNNLGVTNVVWYINFMGYPKRFCMINDLYPGDSLVDWIVWDSYEIYPTGWPESPMALYTFLEHNSNSSHNYLSKPWGLMETGVGTYSNDDPKWVYQQYVNMKTTLDTNAMPRMKMWAIWDGWNRAATGATGYDARVGYNSFTHQPDSIEQNYFNNYANDPRFTDAFYK